MKSNVLIFIVLAAFVTTLEAQKSEIYATDDGAIRGYDPVAYFTDNKPIKGKPEFKFEWQGHPWYFSSEKNLTVFKASPESFAPQYGGYCAFAMSRGYKANTEPQTWSIVDGKLYLLYSRSVQDDWNKQRQHFIQKADQNWPTVRSKEK
jgi:YHS domain-containing protein